MKSFNEKLKSYVSLVDLSLDGFVQVIDDAQKTISEASRYSLLVGGKRIRPVLCLATAELFDTDKSDFLPYACAIEMIHTFSLIHDDLPAMDNDDYRRGRLTSHKVFGEGVAVLTGDSLLNKAYETMLSDCIINPKKGKIEAISAICTATGDNGMIGGQIIDLESENKSIPYDLLKKMHSMKTGALIKVPVIAACYIAQTPADIVAVLEQYASLIGLAFQIKDDILDVTSDSESMGKTVGKDAKSKKSTYISLFGISKAKELLEETTNQAFACLNNIENRGFDVKFLKNFTKYLLKREN